MKRIRKRDIFAGIILIAISIIYVKYYSMGYFDKYKDIFKMAEDIESFKLPK